MYQTDYCNKLIDFVKSTGKPIRAFSTTINTPYSLIEKWRREHIEFAAAVELAYSFYLDYWLDKQESALNTIGGDNPLISVAKSNIDRYYKETDQLYEQKTITEPIDDGKLSDNIGSSFIFK